MPATTTDTAQSGIGADIWPLGLSFIEIASIAAAVEPIVGVPKYRPPCMRIILIPLYAWYILMVAGMIVFAFPPLIAGDILFEIERAFDWPFFDPERGGDPLLWQHLFWILGHPEVYIIFLPAIALVAMIPVSAVTSRAPVRATPYYPMLRGQTAGYLAQQLRLLREGTRGCTAYAHIMATIAQRLSDD